MASHMLTANEKAPIKQLSLKVLPNAVIWAAEREVEESLAAAIPDN